MYKKYDYNQIKLDFVLPFQGDLDPNNRWVILSNEIPWNKFEDEYASQFSDYEGAEAKSFRVALGALLIQKKLGLTDEETVEQIMENPYLQYFIGFTEYQTKKPFHSSMLVHFRKRISSNLIIRINDEIFLKEAEKAEETNDKTTNKGELILDATCAPQDIRFPQDASLLNEAREKLESIIDLIYAFIMQMGLAYIEKPRTYRKIAHKVFLKFTKGKGYKVRKLVKQLLQFVERDLRHIEKMCEQLRINNYELEGILSNKQIKDLNTIIILASQQREMINEKTNKVKDRIVSISQPYIRPIVRNKTRNKVEFGAKIQMAVINGFVCLDKLSWDNFNEGSYLIDSINNYKNKYGYFPEVVLADNIYKTKSNKKFCSESGIRFLGNKTNKEPKIKNKELKKAYVKDLKSRQKVEGKFGNAKRRNSLGLIMTKLQETSETSIGLEIMMLNINKSLAHKLKIA